MSVPPPEDRTPSSTAPERLDWKTARPLLLAGLGVLIVTVILIVGIQSIGLDSIRGFIEGAGPLAPLAFILVKMLTYVVAPLTSGPIQLSAGVLFGLVPGALYTLTGEVIGGSIAFWLSRRFGRAVVRRFVGLDGLAKVDGFVEEIVDWRTLTFARLFLFSAYDFISYSVGFSRLPFRVYLIVSIVAGFIPTLVASMLGSTLAGEAGALLPVFALVLALSALPLLFQRQIRRLIRMSRRVKPAQS
ncbi:MAG: TVP38/TMEM64 family protein [Chloroflexi bacterium]|nr:TVP38/TMEM64 family protein [Chloroflexota bacterium]